MRQGAAQSAPTSLICTITCIIMLIIVNRIQFSHYSSFCQWKDVCRSEHPKRIGKGAHHYSKTEFDAILLGGMVLIRYF